MNRELVIQRIDDWEERLTRLFAQIDDWCRHLPNDCEIFADAVPQRVEEIMHKFDVGPRPLPSRAIIRGEHRVSFVPGTLWVVGANGRVNVTTNHDHDLLLDMGGHGDLPSDWQLATSQVNLDFVPFAEEAFRDLALRAHLSAA